MIAIFNINFELLAVEVNYTNFKWVRRFGLAGDFVMQLPFTQERFKFCAKGNIILKKDVDEAAIIETLNVIESLDGDLILIIKGRHLSSILDRRVFNLTGELTPKVAITTIINQNFINTADKNRNIPNFKLLGFELLDPIKTTADIKNNNAYHYIIKILSEKQMGFKIDFNRRDKTFDLIFKNLYKTNVCFSKQFNNVIEQDYLSDTTNFKNVVYIDDKVYFGNHKGLERRETSTSKTGFDTAENADQTQTAINFLEDKKIAEELSTVVDAYSEQYLYLIDWDIGAIVLSKNDELGIKKYKFIEEVVEFYDEKGLNLAVKLADFKEMS